MSFWLGAFGWKLSLGSLCELSFGGLSFDSSLVRSFWLEASIRNLLGMFWECLARSFRLGAFGWELWVGSFLIGSFHLVAFGMFLGAFGWKHPCGSPYLFLEAFGWELSFGSFWLVAFGWKLSFWKPLVVCWEVLVGRFRLGACRWEFFGWKLSFVSFGLGVFGWKLPFGSSRYVF